MQINESGKMSGNDMVKAGMLLTRAGQLGMDTSGYGVLDVNPNSGYVYLWLEDYMFSLFVPINGKTVMAIWSDPYDGEEHERVAGKSFSKLDTWAAKLDAKSRKRHGD